MVSDLSDLPSGVNRYAIVLAVANDRIRIANSEAVPKRSSIVNGNFMSLFTDEEYRDITVSPTAIKTLLAVHLKKHNGDKGLLANQFECSLELLLKWLDGKASRNTRMEHKQRLHKHLGDGIFRNLDSFI